MPNACLHIYEELLQSYETFKMLVVLFVPIMLCVFYYLGVWVEREHQKGGDDATETL